VNFEPTRRSGIKDAVRLRGAIGGVEYVGFREEALVLDGSLAYSLAYASRFFRHHGIVRVRYSSAHQKRKVRGTSRWSKHSFGLALDVHQFELEGGVILEVRNDYEQGLGDGLDCIGRPLTREGWILRALDCQFTLSGMFEDVLSPDYDAGHYNHFHLEASPWAERAFDLNRPRS